MNSLTTLNPELLKITFNYLDLPTLIKASSVCTRWHTIANQRDHIFVPTSINKLTFVAVKGAEKLDEILVSNAATSIFTHEKKDLRTVIGNDGQTKLQEKENFRFSGGKDVALLAPHLLVYESGQKIKVLELVEKRGNKKRIIAKKSLNPNIDLSKLKDTCSSSTSLGGFGVIVKNSAGEQEKIMAYRNTLDNPREIPLSSQDSEVKKLCILDHYIVVLKEFQETHKIFAYPWNKDALEEKEFDLGQGEFDSLQIASDNDRIVVQEQERFILIPLSEGELYEIPSPGEIIDFIVQNHLLTAIVKEPNTDLNILITWNTITGEQLSNIPLGKGYKQLAGKHNIVAAVENTHIDFYCVNRNNQEKVEVFTISDLPENKINDVFHSIHFSEEKMQIMTSRGLYTHAF